MKRCPVCRRDYYDDTLLYCLDDGNALLDGPASLSEPISSAGGQLDDPQTAILHETAPPSEAATRAQIHLTDQTAVLPSGISEIPKKPFDKRLIVVPILAVILALGVYAGYRYFQLGATRNSEMSLANAKITKLTTSGKASAVAISPDGKYVVHVQNDGGQRGIFIRQVATHSNVQIVPPAPVELTNLKFSHDGNYVYYVVWSPEFVKGALFQVPALGGQPKKILEDLNLGQFSFSPDSGRIVFTRNLDESEYQLIVANADGTNQEILLSSKAPDLLDGIAWSPDGKRIVYEIFQTATGSRLFEMQLADGSSSSRQITDKVWCCGMINLTWTRDGSTLVVSASDKPGPDQIWQISYPSGEVNQLTNEPDGLPSFDLTADSDTFAVVKRVTNANIWLATVEKIDLARPITSGSGKSDSFPSWSPDGKIVFSTTSAAMSTIWSMGADGSSLTQITSNAENSFNPIASPDGKTIAYASRRLHEVHIWLMNVDGSNARQITKGDAYQQAIPTSFSPDGRWLFYTRTGAYPVAWRIAADGAGAPVKITEKISRGTEVSPDGKMIAYFFKDDAKAPFRIAIAPIEGGESVKTFPVCSTCTNLRWTPDGRSLVYAATSPNGVSNLMAQAITGGEPKQLTDFKSELIFSFDYSNDGKQIALSRGTNASDVLLYSLSK